MTVSILPRSRGAARPQRIPLDDSSLLALWRADLQARHFRPRRIERDLKAVVACLHDLGPSEHWETRILAARAARTRARDVRAVNLDLKAVLRFWHFRRDPDETALETRIFDALWNRLSVHGRKVGTYEKERDKVLQFTDAAGFVWRNTMTTMDSYGAARVAAHVARETLRSDQGAVKRFIDFIREPGSDWAAQLEAMTGCAVRQICTPANTIPHVHSAPEGEVGRSFEDEELLALFAYLRERVARAERSGHKGLWTALRDYALFGFMLATGGRDSDLAGTNVKDLRRAHSAIAQFSPYEEVYFLGKSDPGGGAKPRTVPAIELFRDQWVELARYVRIARSHLARPNGEKALFLGERGERLPANEISKIFLNARRGAGLPDDLHAHCLRHTFASMLRSIDVDLAIIQTLLGHNKESTTMRYAKLAAPFVKRRLLECGRRQHREAALACA